MLINGMYKYSYKYVPSMADITTLIRMFHLNGTKKRAVLHTTPLDAQATRAYR